MWSVVVGVGTKIAIRDSFEFQVATSASRAAAAAAEEGKMSPSDNCRRVDRLPRRATARARLVLRSDDADEDED